MLRYNFSLNRFFVSLIIGLNSGISYALLGSTFTAFLDDYNVGLTMIGLLSIRTLPYSFKYLWAPFVDNSRLIGFPKNFGQRKMWLITNQVLLVIFILAISIFDPNKHIYLICLLSFFTAIFAATYDIAMEAFRIEMVSKDQLSKVTFYTVIGYRIGLIISAAFALYLASYISWQSVFRIITLFILPCIIIVYFSKDQKIVNSTQNYRGLKSWLRLYFLEPLISLSNIPKFGLVLGVVALYKISDGYLDTMLIPFLNSVGFSKLEIASISKTAGIVANIIGVGIGAYLVNKLHIKYNLIIASFLAGISNLQFILLINFPSDKLFFMISCIESFCSGFSNVVFINFLSSLCHNKFTGTHYAILASISSLSRAFLSSTAGVVVDSTNWQSFFVISSIFAIPTIIFIYFVFLNNSKLSLTKYSPEADY